MLTRPLQVPPEHLYRRTSGGSSKLTDVIGGFEAELHALNARLGALGSRISREHTAA
jgi:hypothetical protein